MRRESIESDLFRSRIRRRRKRNVLVLTATLQFGRLSSADRVIRAGGRSLEASELPTTRLFDWGLVAAIQPSLLRAGDSLRFAVPIRRSSDHFPS